MCDPMAFTREMLEGDPEDAEALLRVAIGEGFTGWVAENGEAILAKLNDLGVYVSTGSACNSENHTASAVLQAMDVPYSKAMGAIRFSLGRYNTEDEVDFVLNELPKIIQELGSLS